MASVIKLFEQAYALHQQGEISAAIAAYQKLLKKKPNHGDANYLLGTLLATRGESRQALPYLQRAATLMPDSAMVKTNIGLVQKIEGNVAEAERSFRAALRLQSNQPEALNNLSALLVAKGALVEAESLARCSMMQGGQHASYATIQCANALADQGCVEEAVALLSQLTAREMNNQIAWHNYLSMLPYSQRLDADEIFQQHRRWAATLEQPQPATPVVAAERPIRVGYLSPDFSNHPVGLLMQPLLAHHDKERVSVYLYHDSTHHDQQTKVLQGHAHHWREVATLDDAACHTLIEGDAIDILVDLSGHLANNRLALFARRAAPIQVAYLGYCSSTGLKNIDYAISDNAFDPPGEEAFYSETLLRLARPAFAFQPSETLPLLLKTDSDSFTFGSFNTLRKINDEVLELWVEILQASAGSRMIIQAKGLSEPAMAERLVAHFTAAGIDAARLELHDFSDYQRHLQLVARCDLALDPWPWNGHMTTLNTLWMGVPVLSLLGQRRSGRMGAAILQELGLQQFIAESPHGYREKAVTFSQQRDALFEVRSGLRQRMLDSSLLDGKSLAAEMERVYREMLKVS